MSIPSRTRLIPTLAVACLILVATALSGQEAAGQAAASAPSLRPYWHVFIAYTIVILMVGGWAVSIARRLKDVERRLLD
jgi:CcmD family protein